MSDRRGVHSYSERGLDRGARPSDAERMRATMFCDKKAKYLWKEEHPEAKMRCTCVFIGQGSSHVQVMERSLLCVHKVPWTLNG